jgi:hypothetical protein
MKNFNDLLDDVFASVREHNDAVARQREEESDFAVNDAGVYKFKATGPASLREKQQNVYRQYPNREIYWYGNRANREEGQMIARAHELMNKGLQPTALETLEEFCAREI